MHELWLGASAAQIGWCIRLPCMGIPVGVVYSPPPAARRYTVVQFSTFADFRLVVSTQSVRHAFSICKSSFHICYISTAFTVVFCSLIVFILRYVIVCYYSSFMSNFCSIVFFAPVTMLHIRLLCANKNILFTYLLTDLCTYNAYILGGELIQNIL